jgi:arabinoxylan arabinofuranohydrolase
VSTGAADGDVAGYIPVKADENETTTVEVDLDKAITGLQDVYFTFYGEGYEVVDWRFE